MRLYNFRTSCIHKPPIAAFLGFLGGSESTGPRVLDVSWKTMAIRIPAVKHSSSDELCRGRRIDTSDSCRANVNPLVW